MADDVGSNPTLVIILRGSIRVVFIISEYANGKRENNVLG